MLNQVVMIMLLIGVDGNTATGVVPFKSYQECYRSARLALNPQQYVSGDRVCMDAKLFDNLKSATVKN